MKNFFILLIAVVFFYAPLGYAEGPQKARAGKSAEAKAREIEQRRAVLQSHAETLKQDPERLKQVKEVTEAAEKVEKSTGKERETAIRNYEDLEGKLIGRGTIPAQVVVQLAEKSGFRAQEGATPEQVFRSAAEYQGGQYGNSRMFANLTFSQLPGSKPAEAKTGAAKTDPPLTGSDALAEKQQTDLAKRDPNAKKAWEKLNKQVNFYLYGDVRGADAASGREIPDAVKNKLSRKMTKGLADLARAMGTPENAQFILNQMLEPGSNNATNRVTASLFFPLLMKGGATYREGLEKALSKNQISLSEEAKSKLSSMKSKEEQIAKLLKEIDSLDPEKVKLEDGAIEKKMDELGKLMEEYAGLKMDVEREVAEKDADLHARLANESHKAMDDLAASEEFVKRIADRLRAAGDQKADETAREFVRKCVKNGVCNGSSCQAFGDRNVPPPSSNTRHRLGRPAGRSDGR